MASKLRIWLHASCISVGVSSEASGREEGRWGREPRGVVEKGPHCKGTGKR